MVRAENNRTGWFESADQSLLLGEYAPVILHLERFAEFIGELLFDDRLQIELQRGDVSGRRLI